MREVERECIFSVIKCALNGEKYDGEIPFDMITPFIKQHLLASLFLEGIERKFYNQTDYNELKQMGFVEIAHTTMLNHLYTKISKAFDEYDIDYIPLKGLEINTVYPKKNMRYMTDIDILIRNDQYPKIRKVMLSLGGIEANSLALHDYGWFFNDLHVELHHAMTNPENGDVAEYYKDPWSRALQTSVKTQYKFSAEDTYIYLFLHFVKHFRDGGIGLRHCIDLYQYSRRVTLNEIYIEKELERLQLYQFYEILIMTFDSWFNKGCRCEAVDLCTEVIFSNGAFGLSDNRVALAVARKGSKNRYKLAMYLRNVFLPLSSMQVSYPMLRKYKLFLPAFWIYRIIRIALYKQKDIKKVRKEINRVDSIEVSERLDVLRKLKLEIPRGE